MIPEPDMPPTAPLGITVTTDHAGARLTLAGEIDITNSDQILLCARRYLDEPGITQVITDLDAVTFLDSSGLRALMFSRRRAAELGKTFLVQGHHGHVAEVIEVTGLTKFLTDPDYLPDAASSTSD
jgi:anti-anti-sigma factor